MADFSTIAQSRGETAEMAFGAHYVERADQGPVRLGITVDVEEQFDWDKPSVSPSSVPPIDYLKQFHSDMTGAGFRPLYLLTYRMLEDDGLVTAMRGWRAEQTCDCGIHLHCWNTPPVSDDLRVELSYQRNLPPDVERQRLESLFELFEQQLGEKPRFHRAGRYGVGRNSYDCLAALGVEVDLSPSAAFDFSEGGGPDFSAFSSMPYSVPTNRPILCLPVQGAFFFRGPDWISTLLRPRGKGALRSPVRLSPEANPLDRLKHLSDRLVKDGVRDLIITLHSTSLVPKATHYAATEADANALKSRILDWGAWSVDRFGAEKSSIPKIVDAYGS